MHAMHICGYMLNKIVLSVIGISVCMTSAALQQAEMQQVRLGAHGCSSTVPHLRSMSSSTCCSRSLMGGSRPCDASESTLPTHLRDMEEWRTICGSPALQTRLHLAPFPNGLACTLGVPYHNGQNCNLMSAPFKQGCQHSSHDQHGFDPSTLQCYARQGRCNPP